VEEAKREIKERVEARAHWDLIGYLRERFAAVKVRARIIIIIIIVLVIITIMGLTRTDSTRFSALYLFCNVSGLDMKAHTQHSF
jgi:hypothetical protein